MITPSFNIDQCEKFLTIVIRVPFAKISKVIISTRFTSFYRRKLFNTFGVTKASLISEKKIITFFSMIYIIINIIIFCQ